MGETDALEIEMNYENAMGAANRFVEYVTQYVPDEFYVYAGWLWYDDDGTGRRTEDATNIVMCVVSNQEFARLLAKRDIPFHVGGGTKLYGDEQTATAIWGYVVSVDMFADKINVPRPNERADVWWCKECLTLVFINTVINRKSDGRKRNRRKGN